MSKTKIEWSEMVWNPITGCTPISPGCLNCYALRMSKRLAGRYGYPEAPDNFRVTLHPARLNEPMKWKKPRMIFVCSMSDLFHDDVPDTFIEEVFWIIEENFQHTFQILTKRPERMCEFMNKGGHSFKTLPIPNLWLGVTAENQKCADERIPWLLKTPAVVRFVSAEPLLEPIDFSKPLWAYAEKENHAFPFNTMLHWIIVGAETGPGKRPMQNEWAEDILTQCDHAKIPFFFKKDSEGRGTLNGLEYHEFPGRIK